LSNRCVGAVLCAGGTFEKTADFFDGIGAAFVSRKKFFAVQKDVMEATQSVFVERLKDDIKVTAKDVENNGPVDIAEDTRHCNVFS
jgi:hypothetical protein